LEIFSENSKPFFQVQSSGVRIHTVQNVDIHEVSDISSLKRFSGVQAFHHVYKPTIDPGSGEAVDYGMCSCRPLVFLFFGCEK